MREQRVKSRTSMPRLLISCQKARRVAKDPQASASTLTRPRGRRPRDQVEEGASGAIVLDDVGLDQDLASRLGDRLRAAANASSPRK